MVSSAIDLDLVELLAVLERLRVEHADDPDYQKLRKDLPSAWPL